MKSMTCVYSDGWEAPSGWPVNVRLYVLPASVVNLSALPPDGPEPCPAPPQAALNARSRRGSAVSFLIVDIGRPFECSRGDCPPVCTHEATGDICLHVPEVFDLVVDVTRQNGR